MLLSDVDDDDVDERACSMLIMRGLVSGLSLSQGTEGSHGQITTLALLLHLTPTLTKLTEDSVDSGSTITTLGGGGGGGGRGTTSLFLKQLPNTFPIVAWS